MSDDNKQHHSSAYDTMLKRVEEVVNTLDESVRPRVLYAIDQAKEKAVELGELTAEEAERIGDYLIRDMHDAADFIEKNEGEFADWLHLEMDLIEGTLLDSFPNLVDETRMALERFRQEAEIYGEWRTGEVTYPGKFECLGCGHELTLYKTGHLPPCAQCQGTQFKRKQSSGE